MPTDGTKVRVLCNALDVRRSKRTKFQPFKVRCNAIARHGRGKDARCDKHHKK